MASYRRTTTISLEVASLSCKLGSKLHWHTRGAADIMSCMQLIERVQGRSIELLTLPNFLASSSLFERCLLNLQSDCSVTPQYFVES